MPVERTCDLVGRATLASRDHDEQLHDGVVDSGTPRLDNEDILLSDACEDPDTCLALGSQLVSAEADSQGTKNGNEELQGAHIGELGQLRLGRSHTQVLTYLACESWA